MGFRRFISITNRLHRYVRRHADIGMSFTLFDDSSLLSCPPWSDPHQTWNFPSGWYLSLFRQCAEMRRKSSGSMFWIQQRLSRYSTLWTECGNREKQNSEPLLYLWWVHKFFILWGIHVFMVELINWLMNNKMQGLAGIKLVLN